MGGPFSTKRKGKSKGSFALPFSSNMEDHNYNAEWCKEHSWMLYQENIGRYYAPQFNKRWWLFNDWAVNG